MPREGFKATSAHMWRGVASPHKEINTLAAINFLAPEEAKMAEGRKKLIVSGLVKTCHVKLLTP